MATDLTYAEFRHLVEEGLQPDAASHADRAGRTPYERLREIVNNLSRDQRADEIVDALLSVGRTNTSQDTDWWNRFLGIFEDVRQLNLTARLKLVEFYEQCPPTGPEQKAYVLRHLALLGCPVQWDKLPAGSRPDDLLEDAPLAVVDGLVWAERFNEAEKLLGIALERGWCGRSDAEGMVERWEALISEPVGLAFVERSRRLLNGVPNNSAKNAVVRNDRIRILIDQPSSRFATLMAWGRHIRAEVPVHY